MKYLDRALSLSLLLGCSLVAVSEAISLRFLQDVSSAKGKVGDAVAVTLIAFGSGVVG